MYIVANANEKCKTLVFPIVHSNTYVSTEILYYL